mgnify:CR=1 FL=1
MSSLAGSSSSSSSSRTALFQGQYLQLINEARINDVISALPELEALYKQDPSVQYLRGLVTEDAEKALVIYRDILKNTGPQVSPTIKILLPGEFDQKFKFGSSNMFFDKNHHWSKREERRESYFAN